MRCLPPVFCFTLYIRPFRTPRTPPPGGLPDWLSSAPGTDPACTPRCARRAAHAHVLRPSRRQHPFAEVIASRARTRSPPDCATKRCAQLDARRIPRADRAAEVSDGRCYEFLIRVAIYALCMALWIHRPNAADKRDHPQLLCISRVLALRSVSFVFCCGHRHHVYSACL